MSEWICEVEQQGEYAEFYWEEGKEKKKIEKENECFYKFRVERLKNIENRKEFLKITVYLGKIQKINMMKIVLLNMMKIVLSS